ncbi:MAG TPA: LysR family transcriptional regulator, partial [Caulobacter sp.]|nr:LysR family transcriptional regulator [Caulobacter sp.]
QLRIAPSSVTKHVQLIERAVKAALVHRTTRRVNVTEAGERFYEHYRTILSQIDSAAAIVEALSPSGVAAEPLAESGGLKLFSLSGFFMPHDERLAQAPGKLTGVIGAAPTPFDV